jgi:hypothetical protein
MPAYGGPTYGVPGYAAPPHPSGADAALRRTNGFAVASLVLGIVGVGACFFVVPSLLAVIFGAVALNQMKHQPAAYSGRGMAIAGLVLGLVGVALFVLVFAFGDVSFDTR